MAMELSSNTWKVGFDHTSRKKPKIIDVPAGDWEKLEEAIEKVQTLFGVQDCKIVCCYEAGRDGFWIHRGLLKRGIANIVVDSSSILVNRRKRNAKSDNLDVVSLLNVLQDHHEGKRSAMVVNVPSRQDEDDRILHRELQYLKKRQTGLSNHIKALLVMQGIKMDNLMELEGKIPQLRDGNDEALECHVTKALHRLFEEYKYLHETIKEHHAYQEELMEDYNSPKMRLIRALTRLRGIGFKSAWILVMEAFGWRVFNNRKQAGGYTGLTPTPYQSGDSFKEQGISKAGNVRIRWLMVEIAHFWIRWQPGSKLTKWFKERTSGNGRRHKKAMVAALARRLFVSLWQYVTKGIVPEGAIISLG